MRGGGGGRTELTALRMCGVGRKGPPFVISRRPAGDGSQDVGAGGWLKSKAGLVKLVCFLLETREEILATSSSWCRVGVREWERELSSE